MPSIVTVFYRARAPPRKTTPNDYKATTNRLPRGNDAALTRKKPDEYERPPRNL